MKNSGKDERKKRKQKFSALNQALEPRMLFDASLVPAPADPAVTGTNTSATSDPMNPTQPVTQQAVSTDAATPDHPGQPVDSKAPVIGDAANVNDAKSSTDVTKKIDSDKLQEFASFVPMEPPPKELIFIDSRLQNSDTLIQGLGENTEVHYLDATKNGIEQIDAVIQAEKGQISAIHILSHGGSGAVDLGSTTLTDANLKGEYADEIAGWASHLTEDANVLLYGCGVAEGHIGQQFVTDLSVLLGADVAASIDATGSNMAGADWDLEFQTGPMKYGPSDTFSQEALAGFYYVLAKPVVDLDGSATFTATDTFSTGTYTGGSNWASGWVEYDASVSPAFTGGGENSPIGGNIVNPSVASGGTVTGLGTGAEMAILGHTAQVGDYIGRSVNLAGYTDATLSFSYRTSGLTSADGININISTDSGATFVTLAKLANVTSNTTVTYDISGYLTDKTMIQFKVDSGFSGDSSQMFFFDNVTVTATGTGFSAVYSCLLYTSPSPRD